MAEEDALAIDGPDALERPGIECSAGCEVVIEGGVVESMFCLFISGPDSAYTGGVS